MVITTSLRGYYRGEGRQLSVGRFSHVGMTGWRYMYIFQLIKPMLRQMFQFMKTLVVAAVLICENQRYGTCFSELKSGPWNLAVTNENLGHGRFSINKTRVTTISGH
jgi:hypothetical protein